jgi:3-oxoacyl-(acyl-carrier-protein) synthase
VRPSVSKLAITRVGLVTSAGVGAAAVWQAFLSGGVEPGPVRTFATEEFATRMAYEVADWRAATFWTNRIVAYYTRSAQFALKAAEECLDGIPSAERVRLGVILGTQFSPVHNVHRTLDEPEFMTPIKFLSALPSSSPTSISLTCRLHGIATSVSSSVAGLEALNYAADLIRLGYFPALLAGGAEELSRDVYGGCHLAGVLAGRNGGPESCRPFAAERDGMVLGEGSAVLLVEDALHAETAGRAPLAYLAGAGSTFCPGLLPGFDDRWAPAAGCRAIADALDGSGLRADEVDAVFSGANGSREGDAVALQILERTFDGAVPPIVPLKAWTGETFGAFGALATATAVLALQDQRLPGGASARLRNLLVHDYSCEGNHGAIVVQHAAPSRSGGI